MTRTRNSKLFHPAIIGAVIAGVATVIAAALPLILSQEDNASPDDTPAMRQSVPVTAPGNTRTATAADSPPPASATGAPTQAGGAGFQSLINLPELEDFEGWQQDPRTVADQDHPLSLSASPCWLNDNFTATFVVSRRFATLKASVGIADNSPVALPLRFTVLADGKAVFTTTAGIGQVRPVDVDIRRAVQVSLRVGTTSTDQCHGDTVGVWIDPRLQN